MVDVIAGIFMKLAAQGIGGGADFMDNPRLDARRAGAQAVFDPFKAQASTVKAQMPAQQAMLRRRVLGAGTTKPVAAAGAWDAFKRLGTAAGQFFRR